MPTSEIRAEWAAQRIKGLSFFSAAKAAFFGNQGQQGQEPDLRVQLPALRARPDVGRDDRRDRGRRAARCCCGTPVDAARARRRPRRRGRGRRRVVHAARRRHLVAAAPRGRRDGAARRAAGGARRGARAALPRLPHGRARRRRRGPVPRQLDLHPRAGRAGRPHPELPLVVAVDGPRPDKACVGLEYFCFAGDDLWTMDDDDLVELAARELEQLGLAPRSKVERGFAIRVPKAYPIYDADYAERVAGDPRAGSTGSRTSSRSAATACTATTTRITRC